MLTEVKKHLILIFKFFKYNLSAAMEYRGSFIIQVAGMFLNNIFWIYYWWIIFSKVPNIAGYSFRDTMMVWAIATSSFGFGFIVFGNASYLSSIIINGELDSYLTQPKDTYINIMASRMSVSAWGDFIYGIVLFLITFGLDIQKLLLFVLFVILGGLLITSVVATAGVLTFFIGNAGTVAETIMIFIITLETYPEGIYKGYVKWIIFSLLPAGFITFVPVRLLNCFDWNTLLLLFVIDAAYLVLGYWFFKFGLKKYESGNLITTKL